MPHRIDIIEADFCDEIKVAKFNAAFWAVHSKNLAINLHLPNLDCTCLALALITSYRLNELDFELIAWNSVLHTIFSEIEYNGT